jgi:hypothetical protein
LPKIDKKQAKRLPLGWFSSGEWCQMPRVPWFTVHSQRHEGGWESKKKKNRGSKYNLHDVEDAA